MKQKGFGFQQAVRGLKHKAGDASASEMLPLRPAIFEDPVGDPALQRLLRACIEWTGLSVLNSFRRVTGAFVADAVLRAETPHCLEIALMCQSNKKNVAQLQFENTRFGIPSLPLSPKRVISSAGRNAEAFVRRKP